MVEVGKQGIFISDTAAKKLSPYNLSQFKKTLVLDLNALQAFTESDPIFQAWLSTPPNISIFTNDVGYLTSFSEIDPIFTAWQTLYDNHTDWDTAYSWGNHASVGYLTSSALTPYLTSATAAATYQPIGSYLTSITSSNVTTALGYTPVTNARTLTINGTTYDLTADRSWTISTGTTYTFSTGLTNIVGTITSNLSTGVSGGQSVVGGTSSGNNLTLSSTSNATKGKILFGTSAYDEVNNRLGVGTTSPVARLDVSSPSGGAGTGIRLIQAANNVLQQLSYTSIDFTVPTTGLIGQFFATASNYSNPSINLAANSIGLVSWDTNAQLFLAAVGSNGYISFDTGGYGYSNERMRILANGNVGIGQTSPTAVLHIKAGTASAGTAPIKLTSGTNTTVAVAGQMEYNNTFHLTNSDATRRHVVLAPNTTKVTASAPYANDGYIVVNIAGTDFKILTTA